MMITIFTIIFLVVVAFVSGAGAVALRRRRVARNYKG